jgi:hypothetical protein
MYAAAQGRQQENKSVKQRYRVIRVGQKHEVRNGHEGEERTVAMRQDLGWPGLKRACFVK